MKLQVANVPFIAHVATESGFCTDPAKVKAIRNMSSPVDVAEVKRFLGMEQYLSKFLPKFSDITKPLQDLTLKEIEWEWDHPQQDVLHALKHAAASTPVLHCRTK